MRILDRAEAHRQAEARLRGDRRVPLEVVHRPARDGKPGAYLPAPPRAPARQQRSS